MSNPAWTCHRLVAAYNVVLAGVWLAFLGQRSFVPWLALAHAAAATLPWMLARVPARQWGIGAALREMYPLILLAAFWTELDVLRSAAPPASNDHAIARLDEALFGTHLHAEWMPRMDALWFSELMYFSYCAYYVLIFLPPIVVAIQGRRAALRAMTLRLMATYLTLYLVYVGFPVDGPHFLHPPHQGPHTDGLFYRLVMAAQVTGDSRGCAFPSSHVAGAVTIALLAWRWLPPGVALLTSLEALGVALSTVYTQNHYAIDSVAGIAWAVAVQLLLVPALLRMGRPRHRPAVPPLPALTPAFRRAQTPGRAP